MDSIDTIGHPYRNYQPTISLLLTLLTIPVNPNHSIDPNYSIDSRALTVGSNRLYRPTLLTLSTLATTPMESIDYIEYPLLTPSNSSTCPIDPVDYMDYCYRFYRL